MHIKRIWHSKSCLQWLRFRCRAYIYLMKLQKIVDSGFLGSTKYSQQSRIWSIPFGHRAYQKCYRGWQMEAQIVYCPSKYREPNQGLKSLQLLDFSQGLPAALRPPKNDGKLCCEGVITTDAVLLRPTQLVRIQDALVASDGSGTDRNKDKGRSLTRLRSLSFSST